MRYFFIILSLLIIIPLQLTYLYSRNDGMVAGISQESEPILNSVSLGEYHFSLFGYTSPQAEVTFNGQGIYDQTVSDDKGYFEFKNRFSPFSPREACLSAKDQLGRVSSSVCLPPFPVKYNVTIGPVLIPPTVSLDKSVYYLDDEIVLSGQTIPNSKVELAMFNSNTSAKQFFHTRASPQKRGLSKVKRIAFASVLKKLSLIKPVEAFSFPQLTAKTDSKGNFSFFLSSSSTDKFRLFTQVSHDQGTSPESVNINFQIYPWWMVIIRFFLFIFNILKTRWLELTLATEILYLAWIVLKHPLRAIVVRKKYSIVRK